MTSASCPLCGGPLVPHWPAVAIWRCRSCELRLRYPLPEQSTLDSLYHAAWASPSAHEPETGGTTHELANNYVRRMLSSLNLDSLVGLRMIDLGAGDGSMSRALQKHGAEVCAIEPYGYRELRAGGVDAYRALDDVPDLASFDGAVCLEVIEHLLSPWRELQRLHTALRPSGWLLVTTPNATGLNARLRAERWREAMKPGHIMWYTPRTIELLLHRAGFPRCSRLRWSVGNRRLPDALLHRALRSFGLDGSLRYLAFAD